MPANHSMVALSCLLAVICTRTRWIQYHTNSNQFILFVFSCGYTYHWEPGVGKDLWYKYFRFNYILYLVFHYSYKKYRVFCFAIYWSNTLKHWFFNDYNTTQIRYVMVAWPSYYKAISDIVFYTNKPLNNYPILQQLYNNISLTPACALQPLSKYIFVCRIYK